MGSGHGPEVGTIFQDGDLVYAAVLDRELAKVEAILGAPPDPNDPSRRNEMRVAIAGAGNVGRSIAHGAGGERSPGLLIDKDPRAIKAESLDQAEWLLADACELSSLEEAGLDTCDVAIAATGDDKANLVMSLLAKTEFGVPRTVGRVNHPKNEWMFNEVWGVDVAVSTPRLMSALVEEAVTVGDLVRLLTFHEGATNLVEMTLPASSPTVGHRIGDMTWPGDVVLVAIIRDGHARPPDPDGSLEAGDELLFVTAQDYEKELAEMLSPREGSIAVARTATPASSRSDLVRFRRRRSRPASTWPGNSSGRVPTSISGGGGENSPLVESGLPAQRDPALVVVRAQSDVASPPRFLGGVAEHRLLDRGPALGQHQADDGQGGDQQRPAQHDLGHAEPDHLAGQEQRELDREPQQVRHGQHQGQLRGHPHQTAVLHPAGRIADGGADDEADQRPANGDGEQRQQRQPAVVEDARQEHVLGAAGAGGDEGGDRRRDDRGRDVADPTGAAPAGRWPGPPRWPARRRERDRAGGRPPRPR